jgi:hypothetical protein
MNRFSYLFIAMMMMHCSQDNGRVGLNGGGDDVTTGVLFYQNGFFASHCDVIAVPSNAVPGSGVPAQFKTVTDGYGRYSFTSIPADTYNLYAKKDSLASYREGAVLGNPADHDSLPNDTLKPIGGIRGIVKLSASSDSRIVLILMIGGTVITWPDDSTGRFYINGLAEGMYRLRFLTTDSRYRVLDTSFAVISSQTADVGTIVLQAIGTDIQDSDTVVVRDRYINGLWGPNKTYKIMCSVVIPQGDRLEIKEGTHVVFMGNYDFGTDGNCFARGCVDNPILFTYGCNYAGQGWNYLGTYMEGNYNKILNFDSVVFNNCIFEYCMQPYFETIKAPPELYLELNNCVLRHMQNRLSVQCLGLSDQSRPDIGKRIVIKNCVFHDIKTVDTLSGDEYILPIIFIFHYDKQLPCDAPFIQIFNNIFYQERWGGTDCHFTYNCYDTTRAETLFQDDSTCVYSDPLFVDIQKGDYHLQPHSPCRRAGLNGGNMGLEFGQ